MNKVYLKYKYDIIFWVLFISHSLFSTRIRNPNLIFFFISFAFYFLGLFVAFYTTQIALLYFNKRGLWAASFLFIFGYIIGYLLEYQRYFLRPIYAPYNPLSQPFEFQTFIIIYLGDFMTMSFYSLIFWYWRRKAEIQKNILNLEINKTKIIIQNLELESNKNKIIEMTDDILRIAEEKAKPLTEDIKALSTLMNYFMNSNHNSLISLETEIQNTKTFIDLNQKRFSNKLIINFSVDGDMANHKVPHMSIITLVENAFKHGNLKLAPLDIVITNTEKVVHVFIKNKKNKVKAEHSTNIGLKNLERRLHLLLENKYTFRTYEDKDDYFYAELEMQS
jgi:two-component system, LytTR family, sensor kinase